MKLTIFAFVAMGLLSVSATAADYDFSRLIHQTSFAENWSRYPSPDEILLKLHADFPLVGLTSMPQGCSTLAPENRALLGDSEPATGHASVDRPNSSFVNWYTNCVVGMIKSEVTSMPVAESAVREYFTGEVIDACVAKDPSPYHIPVTAVWQLNCGWRDLSEPTKRALIAHSLRRFIGPEDIVIDLGIAQSDKEIEDLVLKQVEDFAVKLDSRFDFLSATTETTLSVTKATLIIEFLVNLEGALKF